jgi:sulfoxide reductase catalytic subunit YedY
LVNAGQYFPGDRGYHCRAKGMLIKKPSDISPREITDESAYLTRRAALRAGALAASVAATASVYRWFTRFNRIPGPSAELVAIAAAKPLPTLARHPTTQPFRPHLAPGESPTSFYEISHYNNYYEFTTDKEAVAEEAAKFVTTPWTIRVEGLCSKPATLDLDVLAKLAPLEDRIYRHRCVEGWSMVIPWVGFPLSKLLDRVQPKSSAKFVAFQTLYDPDRMPGQSRGILDWPYVEGLRMDEAMHPLTLLACGIYGKSLLPQNGAPWRLVLPWKYGFKGIKAIVKISLVDQQPPTSWSQYAPETYSFYSNVIPTAHRGLRTQDTETRIVSKSDESVRDTQMYNGYADQVAHLYANLDPAMNY